MVRLPGLEGLVRTVRKIGRISDDGEFGVRPQRGGDCADADHGGNVSEMLRETTGYSFPSGHAMGSTLVFGALIYIAFRTFKSRRARAFWAAVCIASVLAISFSRIYLGVHWISDIVAGIAAGTTWVLATTSGYEIYRRMRRIRRGREAVQPQA